MPHATIFPTDITIGIKGDVDVVILPDGATKVIIDDVVASMALAENFLPENTVMIMNDSLPDGIVRVNGEVMNARLAGFGQAEKQG